MTTSTSSESTGPRSALSFADPSHLLGILQSYQRRGLKWFLLAAVVGALTGLVLAGFEVPVRFLWAGEGEEGWTGIHGSGNLLWYLIFPALGIMGSVLLLRVATPSHSSETTEAYVVAYHTHRSGTLRLVDLPGRLGASISTLALGGSLGLEGPGVLTGATFGRWVQARFARWFDPEDVNILMVAGAAAGIAAVFKAPLTGVVFALELPYQEDLVRRALIPALIASSSSYLVFALFQGTGRLFGQFDQAVELEYRDLVLAILLGVMCALAARLFILILRTVGNAADRLPGWSRAPILGLLVGTLGVLSYLLTDQTGALPPAPDAIGFGLLATRHVAFNQLVWWSLILLAVMKMLASSLTAKAGGVGGLFFSLVFVGATVGRLFAEIPFVEDEQVFVFTIVGIAAAIGAGYRTPLTAVAFVAEATGQPGFIIPALIAAATAHTLMGHQSISPQQRTHFWTGVERSLSSSVTEVLGDPPKPIQGTMTLEEFAGDYLLLHRARFVPVVDGEERLIGLMAVSRLTSVEQEEWPHTTVAAAMNPEPVRLLPDQNLGEAAADLLENDTDHAVVVDDHDRPIGVVSVTDILKLEEVLHAVSRSRLVPDEK